MYGFSYICKNVIIVSMFKKVVQLIFKKTQPGLQVLVIIFLIVLFNLQGQKTQNFAIIICKMNTGNIDIFLLRVAENRVLMFYLVNYLFLQVLFQTLTLVRFVMNAPRIPYFLCNLALNTKIRNRCGIMLPIQHFNL